MLAKTIVPHRVAAVALTVIAIGVLGGEATPSAQAQSTDSRARPVVRDTPPPAAKESVHPPVQPAPSESRTPEEAAKRAADPKDPSGALIVAPMPAKP